MVSHKHTNEMDKIVQTVSTFSTIYEKFHKAAKVFGIRIVKEDVFHSLNPYHLHDDVLYINKHMH